MTFTAYQCPETGQPLTPASPELVDQVNHAIQAGTLLTVDGQAVQLAIEGGWVSESQARLYPLREQIVSLLSTQALDLHTLADSGLADSAKSHGDPS